MQPRDAGDEALFPFVQAAGPFLAVPDAGAVLGFLAGRVSPAPSVHVERARAAPFNPYIVSLEAVCRYRGGKVVKPRPDPVRIRPIARAAASAS